MSVNSTLDPAEERFSELEHRGNKFPRTRHGKKSENSGERDSNASLLPVSAPLRSSTGSSTVHPGESLRHGPAPHEGHRRPPTLPAPSPTHTRSATVFRYRSREKQPPRQLDSLPAPSLGRDAPAMRVTLSNFHGRRFRTRRARPARLGQTPDTSGLNARAGSFVKLLRHPR